MIWLLWNLLTLPIRLVFGTIRLTVRTVLLVGIGRIVLLGAGIGIGLLVAPGPGRELRQKLERRIEDLARRGGLQAQISAEIANSPRTWHLPAPRVSVSEGKVTLTGEVPHETGKEEIGRVAMSVAGVHSVDNQLDVKPA